MALWQFQCDIPDGIIDCKVSYRGYIEATGALAQNDLTRVFDDTVALDKRAIKSLENHKYWDKATNSFQPSFTKLSA